MLFHKNKCIVIAGCGPLGAALAKSLYKKGHKVVVLDKDRESFRYLPEEFRGYEMEGDPTDPQVLKAAGIEDAGLFIASTQDDNTNLLLAQIANDPKNANKPDASRRRWFWAASASSTRRTAWWIRSSLRTTS